MLKHGQHFAMKGQHQCLKQFEAVKLREREMMPWPNFWSMILHPLSNIGWAPMETQHILQSSGFNVIIFC